MILLLMVLIHEAGHYTTAKILGFTIDEFAIGFGPKLFSRRRKNGELFSLRALPLGGFCAFYGEDEDENKLDDNKSEVSADQSLDTVDKEKDKSESGEKASDDDLLSYVMQNVEKEHGSADTEKRAETVSHSGSVAAVATAPTKPRLGKDGKPALPFNAQKPWKRLIVLIGGVLFNFLSAFIFSLIYIGVVGFPVPEITEVYTYVNPETQAVTKYNDFEVGDKIIAINGIEITVMRSYNDIIEEVGNKDTIKFKVLRGGKKVDVVAERKQITPSDDKQKPYLGFGYVQKSCFIGNNAGNAFTYCVPYTFKLSWSILGAFGDILTGRQSITSMTGPVGSISLMAQVSVADWRNILILLPLLASNLAIFNLLPFPALDGSRMVFTAIEWVRKKPINRKVEGMIHFVGMVVLLLFVLVVDILSFAL
ncbi:MAG: site-2 protease family protein [Clostridiales bacterium]|nr:site-2 protease family protein [Clostridiales bacterium]